MSGSIFVLLIRLPKRWKSASFPSGASLLALPFHADFVFLAIISPDFIQFASIFLWFFQQLSPLTLQCNAMSYMYHALDGASSFLNNEKLFPNR